MSAAASAVTWFEACVAPPGGPLYHHGGKLPDMCKAFSFVPTHCSVENSNNSKT